MKRQDVQCGGKNLSFRPRKQTIKDKISDEGQNKKKKANFLSLLPAMIFFLPGVTE